MSDVPHLPFPSPGGRYEHLVNLLTKIPNQRPEDPLFLLESLNRTTQWEWFHPKLDTLRDDPEMQTTYEMAERHKALFSQSGGGEGEQEMEEEVVSEAVGRGARRKSGGGPGLGTAPANAWRGGSAQHHPETHAISVQSVGRGPGHRGP